MSRSIMLAVALVAVLAADCLSASYSFRQLDLEGSSGGYGINNSGQVVGQSGVWGPAVLYSGGMKHPVAAVGNGLDINENGQIVGAVGFSTPFLYSGGILKELYFPGTTNYGGAARAINNNGDVVGEAYGTDAANATIGGAFLYSGGAMQLLGATNSRANDINDNGQIVGSFANGFLYSNGVSSNPGTLPGALGYEGLSINEAGDIAGRAVFPGFVDHAFAYIDGVMHDLGPGQANGINESGQVVGSLLVGSSAYRAFLYSSGALYDLSDLHDSPFPLRLSWASAINDVGQITGVAQIDIFCTFLLTPVPEPSSLVLAALGLIGLVAWGWRRTR